MVRCYITDRSLLPGAPGDRIATLLDCVGRAARQGATLIQLREKDLPARELFALGQAAQARLAGTGGKLLINDRLDIALAVGAAGVHLPAAGLPVAAVRRAAPAGFLITRSCHSPAEAAAAARDGADFCLVAPIFPTPSKPGAVPLGIEALRAAAAHARVLALGGVTEENIAACLAAGAAGMAGIRYFQPPGIGDDGGAGGRNDPR
jgi:thiamine-phosphate pyrophosphorylase